MPEALGRCYPVAEQLFEFLRLRVTSLLLTRPKDLPVDADFPDASAPRDERYPTQFVDEGRQQFLSHPRATQEEAALAAVFDFDTGLGHSIRAGTKHAVSERYAQKPWLVRLDRYVSKIRIDRLLVFLRYNHSMHPVSNGWLSRA